MIHPRLFDTLNLFPPRSALQIVYLSDQKVSNPHSLPNLRYCKAGVQQIQPKTHEMDFYGALL